MPAVPTRTRDAPRTAQARTTTAITKIANHTGLPPAEVRRYLVECVNVANRAVAAGADVDLVGDFIDRVSVPTADNTMRASLPVTRPGSVTSRHGLLGGGSPMTAHCPAGHGGLFVRHADGRFENWSARAHTPAPRAAKPRQLPVEELVAIIRASVMRAKLSPRPPNRH